MIDKMVDLAITYPYLEDDAFCRSWLEADKTDERIQRYENYCCFVFNVIETIWKFCHGCQKQIDTILYVQEIVMRHQSWWKLNPENLPGYAVGFHDYIENFLKPEQPSDVQNEAL